MIFIRDEYYRGSLQKAIEKRRRHGDEHGGNNGNREKEQKRDIKLPNGQQILGDQTAGGDGKGRR